MFFSVKFTYSNRKEINDIYLEFIFLVKEVEEEGLICYKVCKKGN